MKPWHYARIKIGADYPWLDKVTPFQNYIGGWVFFWIYYRHDATKTPFRQTYQAMTTIGLDGVE